MPEEISTLNPRSAGPRKLLVAGLVVIILAGGLYLLFSKAFGKTSLQVTYTGNDLKYTQLNNTSTNGFIGFLKPAQFKLRADVQPLEFLQTVGKGSQPKVTIGFIADEYGQLDPSFIAKVNASTGSSDPATSAFAQARDQTRKFTSNEFISNYSLVFDDPQPFNNGQLSANAWSMNFTATNSKHTYKGKAIFFFGKHTYSYFVLSSLDQDWQPNQAIWQKITDSLRLVEK